MALSLQNAFSIVIECMHFALSRSRACMCTRQKGVSHSLSQPNPVPNQYSAGYTLSKALYIVVNLECLDNVIYAPCSALCCCTVGQTLLRTCPMKLLPRHHWQFGMHSFTSIYVTYTSQLRIESVSICYVYTRKTVHAKLPMMSSLFCRLSC